MGANGGFTMTHKITHGENVIQEGEMVFDVKANDGSKFEMEHLHKMTMTEESPFYSIVHWYTGRYAKNVERKMTVFFDKINKSILFVPKMKMDTVMTVDGETTNGFLRRISPVETNVVTSINMRNLKVDAIVWKSFAGKKYGFTLTNDKFLLLAGDH